ncbi:MAG TPA: sigma 54-interacting transcriptional regulator [Myxococcales bacterium]|nr:sigma 54-interacting transcriptional regulator [Myxococcales bacterium]
MPIDSSRLEELQIVRKVRETVRRWWGIELSFTDAKGYVLDHGKGIIIPPQNRICTACLGDKEGLRRCNESIERAVSRLSEKTELLGPCHMGLEIIGTPIEFGGDRQGSLFACGFLVDEKSGKARPQALDEVQTLSLPVVQPQDAFETIQRIEAREVPRLADLMDTTVEEIDAYHDAVALREKRIRDLQDELVGRYRFADIIGKSEPMRRLYALLDKLVESDVTVLIHGENGTGKELIARALHFNGPRKQRQFVAQNCSALNDQLLESELFGHVKGSFTGATRDKPGLFKVADGGTFFLDEVADMSAAMQVKLLRVLQEGTFVPVGATRPEKVDVRIIAASNKDLREMVVRREFREDLFYRLHVVALEVPALRERLDDLPLLVDQFLDSVVKRTGKPRKKLHPELMAAFYEWHWPGNVRELENEIERLCVLAGDAEVIPPELRAQRPAKAPGSAAHLAALVQRGLGSDLATAVGALEKELIETGLRETRGNKSKLAERLGVSRTTLIKKIRDYGIAE